MVERDLVTHVARFAGALRGRGVGVGLSDEVDAVQGLMRIDLFDRDEVCSGLRTTLKIRRRDQPVFDELFERLWAGDPQPLRHVDQPTRPPTDRSGSIPRLARRDEAAPGLRESDSEEADGTLPGYSPEAVLRRKPFDQCSERDLAAMERLLARLVLRLATCRSRRLVPTRTRGTVDLRRSFRRLLATRGEPLSLALRSRAVEEPRLVLLCDTSGSMDSHARFLLAFVLSLRRVARRAEIFAFSTSLTRLTPWLSPRKVALTLDRLAARVPDWSGGTRIGESLADFVARYQNEVVNAQTVVVILSDGLDRGDPAQLVRAMRAIRRRARKLIWLNPLLGDRRYRPIARGMAAALPLVDEFMPAHNLESLERLLPHLGA